MPDAHHHISSAVVVTRPETSASVAEKLAALEGVEVHGGAPGKIVVVIEGPNAEFLGETLIHISAMAGVLAAHMVFEQAIEEEEMSHDDRTHAA